jgi:hypothetical protein
MELIVSSLVAAVLLVVGHLGVLVRKRLLPDESRRERRN